MLPGLQPDRLHPAAAHAAQPRDSRPGQPICSSATSRIWVVPTPCSDRVLVGLFNLAHEWENRGDIQIDYPLEKLGLETAATYDSYEFWTDTAGTVRERLNVTVPLESCRVLALRP
ncbi:MAG: hypothetical protein U1F87_01030 [Kiritimatiellia bacterium]